MSSERGAANPHGQNPCPLADQRERRAAAARQPHLYGTLDIPRTPLRICCCIGVFCAFAPSLPGPPPAAAAAALLLTTNFTRSYNLRCSRSGHELRALEQPGAPVGRCRLDLHRWAILLHKIFITNSIIETSLQTRNRAMLLDSLPVIVRVGGQKQR